MSKNVLVIGSINVDYVIHTGRLPKLGETITGSDFAMNFGGKGANQAVALAKAGCTVKMLGAVGSDQAGELALENLKALGVDCSEVLRVSGATGAAVITVCDGDNHIILDCGANGKVTPDVIEAKADLFDWADALVMQYEIPTESVLCAAKLARKKGKRVILNPAPVKQVDSSLYENVDDLILNETETDLIAGIFPADRESTVRSIAALRGMGAGNVIVTLGSKGCAYNEGDAVSFAGIYPVKRVDTTAAGDSFIGGFCARMCESAPLAEAIDYATATSAITVSRAGAAVSIPCAEEVIAFRKTHRIEQAEF